MIEWIMDCFGYIPCPKCGKYGYPPLSIYKYFACMGKGCDTAIPNFNLEMRNYWKEQDEITRARQNQGP